jgi:DNA helicase IV
MSVTEEQANVTSAYAHLDALIDHLDHRIRTTASAPSTGTGQDLLEREALLDHLSSQLRSALSARQRLCFGRIDDESGETRHIGRIGLRDAQGDPLLLDWRAPNAAAFYQATPVDPMGVRRRRRIATHGRTVTHVEDEDLTDVLAVTQSAASAVNAPRDGRMADIVATIAADQDRIIRQPLQQVTVVEGGPGTGKTVVALHRAAWLLYTHRDSLAKDGVLVIGPSQAFLHYIDQVLPSLGETDVVLLTPGQLFPGVSAFQSDPPEVAAIKGDIRMADVISRAVRQRRRIPTHDVAITMEDGATVVLTAAEARAAEKSVAPQASFHVGRDQFLRRVMSSLVVNRARQLKWDVSDDDTRTSLLADLADDRHVRREVNLMWLPISPEHLIGRLLTQAEVLAAAAEGILSRHEQQLLLRSNPGEWKVDDVPLLDEAAELLGPWDPHAAQHERAKRVEQQEALANARRALDTFQTGSWLTAEALVARDDTATQRFTVAERAIHDRTWIYGHVVVDEAQDLSAMAWRAVSRRCHRRSATVVGDIQQSAHPAAVGTWAEALSWAKDRMHVETLTITYRITRQTAQTAVDALTAAGGTPPELLAIRDGSPTTTVSCAAEDLHEYIIRACHGTSGRAAVIVPDDWSDLGIITRDSLDFGLGAEGLDRPIAVLRVGETKGLEFDRVFLIEPSALMSQRPRGADIYVAATRPTQELFWMNITDSLDHQAP